MKNRSSVSFVLDSATCGVFAKTGTGTWDVSLYFSLRNRADLAIRITNINATKDFSITGSSAALTTGSREIVDLRTKDALLRENKFFDLVPGEEQPICGKLEVESWFRSPRNKIDSIYALIFSLSVEYRVVSVGEVYSVEIPVFYYVHPTPTPEQPHGSILCVSEHNIDKLIDASKSNDAVSKALERMKLRISDREKEHAILTWADSSSVENCRRPIAVAALNRPSP